MLRVVRTRHCHQLTRPIDPRRHLRLRNVRAPESKHRLRQCAKAHLIVVGYIRRLHVRNRIYVTGKWGCRRDTIRIRVYFPQSLFEVK